MPRLISIRVAAACALALSLSLATVAVAGAKGPRANLRVVNTAGKTLAEGSYAAATASVKTSRRADCFGSENAGSGKTVKVKGPTPLGLLSRASKTTAALRPVLVTDAFDFGLGLCGIGGSVAEDEGSWFLKVNHRALTVGGDKARLKAGDDVLWYLAASFPYPDELGLSAPGKVKAGTPFKVRVFSYDDKGKRKPVAGATVGGAAGPTGSDGRATVTLSRPAKLLARHGEDIPSNREAVCVGARCPRG